MKWGRGSILRKALVYRIEEHKAMRSRDTSTQLCNSACKVFRADLGMSLDSKSADKELKAVTLEESKSCVTAFAKKLVTTFQLSRTRSGQ